MSPKIKLWAAPSCAVLGFLALMVILFPRVILSGEMFFCTEPMAYDIPRLNLPLRRFFERSLKERVFPLWSREVYCGFPIHAEGQGGFCHPMNLLGSLLFSAPGALNFTILVSLAAAGLLLMLYARAAGLSWPAAFLAAVSFAFSAYNIQKIQHVNILLTECWLGLVFYGLEKYFQSQRPAWILLAGVGWALQILAGNPGYAYDTFWAVLAYSGYRIFTGNSSRSRSFLKNSSRMLLVVASFAAVGACLSAVQWIPTWELTRLSVRGGGLSYGDAVQFHYYWRDLLAWLHPNFMGDPSREIQGFDRGVEAWENASFVGVVPLCLALAAMVGGMKRPGLHRFLTVLFLVSMALVLETPVYKLFWMFLPGFRLFRVPAKLLFLAIFAVSVLAGMGLDRLTTRFSLKWSNLLKALALIFSAGQLWAYGHAHTITIEPKVWLRPPRLIGHVQTPRTRMISCGAQDVLWALQRALVLARAPVGKVRLFPYLVYKELLGSGAELTWGLYGSDSRSSPIPLRRLQALHDAASSDDVARQCRLSSRDAQLFRLQSIEFIAAPQQIQGRDCRLVDSIPSVHAGTRVFLHRLRNPLARAFVVGERTVANSPPQFFATLFSSGFDPSRTVILEKSSPPGDPAARSSPVEWDRDDPQETSLQVEMKGNGYLVLSDTYYPGWHAAVDGQEKEILRANGNFRALWLTPGSHRVTFLYKPLSFLLGLEISVFSALALGAWTALELRRRLSMVAQKNYDKK
jgi:hypothetical protein